MATGLSVVTAVAVAVCLLLVLNTGNQVEAATRCDDCGPVECGPGCETTAKDKCVTECSASATPSACKACKLLFGAPCFKLCVVECMASCQGEAVKCNDCGPVISEQCKANAKAQCASECGGIPSVLCEPCKLASSELCHDTRFPTCEAVCTP